jgi:hypothetical protein
MITTINEFRQINERNWKYHLDIKQHLRGEDFDDEAQVITICNIIINQLKRLINKIDDSVKYELEEIVDNFDFLKQLADGTIPEDTFQEYSFDGNFTDLFNDYLESLYDFGDSNDIWIK